MKTADRNPRRSDESEQQTKTERDQAFAKLQILFATYFRFCSWLDYNAGQVLAALAECGLGDETTVSRFR